MKCGSAGPGTPAILVAMLATLIGCGDSAPVREVLFDWNLDAASVPESSPSPGIHHDGMQMFADGWQHIGEHGVWTDGPEATVRMLLLADDVEIRLDCATNPALAERGQSVEVLLNGNRIGTHVFTRGWERQTLTLNVPSDVRIDGDNTLTLRPAITGLADDGHEGMGVFVYRLTAKGVLDRGSRRRLEALSGPAVGATVYRQETKVRSRTTGGPKPDLLVILLDAARADHFGCYGYHRNTTPFIDSLAGDGVVFRQVIATAPYTLCSVPTIMTGRNWLEHDVLERGDVLPRGFPTLAGVLREAGYATIGYSENPYVSAATGLDRGFDEFYRNWESSEGDHVPTRELVESALPAWPANSPVFCYVHLMPPHEPYTPTPEHDIFTDPAYAGPANGGSEYIRSVDLGEAPCRDADRDHLMGLYDGNLHMADAWVAQIIGAWRRIRPDRETLTVIVSDHGEAFGEHGRFAHNSTLYREMMHVPLIMHPAHLVGDVPDPAQLRSLADTMPMILGMLGIDVPRDVSWPRHFVDVYRGRAGARSMIAERTTAGARYGLRTPHLLATYGSRVDQRFYDLTADPDQRDDVRPTRGLDYYPLAGTILELLEFKSEHGITSDKGGFDEAAEQRLEALGY